MNLSLSSELSKRQDSESPAQEQAPLVVRHITQRFGDTLALDDVSMSVKKGDIGVIIGGSGAGKTTLLRSIIGLNQPTSGSILIEGHDITQMSEEARQRVRSKFGMVFQQAALLDSLTILENIALPLREHTRLTEKEMRERVREKLDALNLGKIEEHLPSELSGGMRKRVGIARALILEPSLLLYDEPTSGLDPLAARTVDNLIQKTRDRFGVTSVVISHDMAEAQSIADKLYVLDEGRLVAQGTCQELCHKSGGLTARFFEASLVRPPAS